MALIYRSILEVDDGAGTFVERVPEHVRDWLRWKLRDNTIDLVEGRLEDHDIELSVRSGHDETCSVARIEVYEGHRDDGVQVKTTVTAIRDETASWAWVDLERWTHEHAAIPWIPAPPGVVTTLLIHETTTRGNLTLSRNEVFAEGEMGRLVADLVLDADRAIPLIVVSYSEREDSGPDRAVDRGRELARRLAGVASVYVLGPGAVSTFSRAMLDAVGEGMDVHSGAVRTYLPGAGTDSDSPSRHRFIPFHRLERRASWLASRIMAPSILQRSAEVPPPRVWRSSARALLVEGRSGNDYEDLLLVADDEISDLKDTAEDLRGTVAGLRDSLDAQRADNYDLLRQNDDLSRQLRYVRTELAASGSTVASSQPIEDFEPVLCTEVLAQAREHLSMLEIPASVDEGAEQLDAHGDESWAARSWSALRALDNYAQLKADGLDGSFFQYCEQGLGDFRIPVSWVSPAETAMTLNNPKFRRLRTLPVSSEVEADGSVLMQEHIRIERGGSPAPRIYYYDDTRGSTGRVHVGWLGPHLDSWAKS
jgi:hypothetical protein